MRTTLPSFAGLRPEVRRADRLLDRGHQRRVERLRDDQRRLGDRQRRHLVDRHLRAVGLDVNAVEQADGGAPGADVRHVAPDALDAGVHARLHFAEHAFQIAEIHVSPSGSW